MRLWNQYLRPSTVEEAVKQLGTARGSAAVIAGGTDLLLDLREGRHAAVEVLIDVMGIDEMCQISLQGNHIYLGASVTHMKILSSHLLRDHANVVVEGCGLIGGPQVRNVATIGGNVAHALPAGDGTISLLTLDAQAQIASAAGRRWQPIQELFAGPGKTTFDRERELLVGFSLPLRGEGEGSAFRRIMRPQGVAIAILNMGAWVRVSGDGTLGEVRLAVGPAGPRPARGRQTEAFLRGRRLDAKTLTGAAQTLLGEIQLRTSRHRATQAYRSHLVAVLLEDTLRAALEMARGD